VPSDTTASQYRQRAAEMRSLAEKTPEPAFRRSCEEVAEGWEALANQQDALAQTEQSQGPRPHAATEKPRYVG
jgi:hypothetical protein